MRRCSGEELERVDDGPCFDYLRTSSWALFVFLFELWPAIPVIGVFGPVLNAYCCGVITEPMAWRDVVPLIVLMCYWLSFFSTAFGTLLICKFGMLVLLKDCFLRELTDPLALFSSVSESPLSGVWVSIFHCKAATC